MYTEQRRMSIRLMALLAMPFAITVVVLAGLLVLLPLPRAVQIAIFCAMLLEAVVGVLLVASLSRVRLTIDDRALTVAFRLFFKKRIALDRIVRCTPTDARVWGFSYHAYEGYGRYRGHAGPRRAVMLILTNDAQFVVGSQHADAVCAALRARRPQIG